MLKVENLKTIFKIGVDTLTAVDHISFEVPKQKVVGIVGESGSGKSVTSLSILRLLPPNGKIVSGQLMWNGVDLMTLSNRQMHDIRGAKIGLIFQNPLAALNPVFTIGNQLIETIRIHGKVNSKTAKDIAIDLLQKVNIPDAAKRLSDYPHQFSLGMCQRIMIAITLAMKPQLLIADEPTASLDVTIQSQILELLSQIKADYGMSILLISHDMGVIAQHCDELIIMYLGTIVEKGSIQSVFKQPKHPYTQALLASIPVPDPEKKQVCAPLKGDIPSPLNLPTGCRFHTRCLNAMPKCLQIEPKLVNHGGHWVACWLSTCI